MIRLGVKSLTEKLEFIPSTFDIRFFCFFID